MGDQGEHGCRFRDDDRRVVCRCGWVSSAAGAAGVTESFDHFDAVAPVRPPAEAAERVARRGA